MNELLEKAAHLVVSQQMASVGLLQRRLKITYKEAQALITQLENYNIIGPFDGNKALNVLIMDQLELNGLLDQNKSEYLQCYFFLESKDGEGESAKMMRERWGKRSSN